jgi:heme/copper-type cytochrome/quinol oxidase subunit 3
MAHPATDLNAVAETAGKREPLRIIRGGGGGPVRGGAVLPGGNGVLGMVIFLMAEAMLFAGLISAYLILRAGTEIWPPPGQPRLPAAITLLNSVILIASGVTMTRAAARIGRCSRGTALRWLGATLLLGATFLTVQGIEWARMLRFGLQASHGVYGGLFYTLIGCHAAHVLVAVLALLVLVTRLATSEMPPAHLQVLQLYWLFVVAVWPVLYLLVYVA